MLSSFMGKRLISNVVLVLVVFVSELAVVTDQSGHQWWDHKHHHGNRFHAIQLSYHGFRTEMPSHGRCLGNPHQTWR